MERVKFEGELSSCPECGAGGGFHVAFRNAGPRSTGKLEVVLVCPSCRYRFTVGEFLLPDGEPRPFDPSLDGGQ
jgi:C4-type Zn-finger protein